MGFPKEKRHPNGRNFRTARAWADKFCTLSPSKRYVLVLSKFLTLRFAQYKLESHITSILEYQHHDNFISGRGHKVLVYMLEPKNMC